MTDDDFQIAANTLQEFLEASKIEVGSRANIFRSPQLSWEVDANRKSGSGRDPWIVKCKM